MFQSAANRTVPVNRSSRLGRRFGEARTVWTRSVQTNFVAAALPVIHALFGRSDGFDYLRRCGVVISPVTPEAAARVVTPFHPKRTGELQIFFQNLDNAIAPQPNRAPPEMPPDEFSIEAGYTKDAFKKRVRRVAAEYAQLDAEVMAFSEIDREFFEELCKLPPFAGLHAEPIELGTPRSMAIFSKLPIDSIELHRVEIAEDRPYGKRRRPVVEVRLALPSAPTTPGSVAEPRQLGLVLCHHSARKDERPEDPDQEVLRANLARERGIQVQAEVGKSLEADPKVQGVLHIGDFNSEPTSELISGVEGLHVTPLRSVAAEQERLHLLLGDLDEIFGPEARWGTRYKKGRLLRPDMAMAPSWMLPSGVAPRGMLVVPHSFLVMSLGEVPIPFLALYDAAIGKHYLDTQRRAGSNHHKITVRCFDPSWPEEPAETLDWTAFKAS